MKKVLTTVVLLAMVAGVSAQNTKHVFWYNGSDYNIADATGPNIQGTVVLHEGKSLTATTRILTGNQELGYNLGNGDVGNGFSNVIWYADLCSLKLSEGATLTSAKFRGEYRDNYMGNAFCQPGAINARVGVVSVERHLTYLGVTPDEHPDNAQWADALNPVNTSMGFSGATSSFVAQQTKNITAPQGNSGSAPVLEGQFFEMDITVQVDTILRRTEVSQLGIASICPIATGGAGKINLYATEDGNVAAATADRWSQDGNSAHLVLEITGGTLVGKIAVESGVAVSSNETSISSKPNPCNPVTTISYNTGVAKHGIVKIFSAEGKLVHSVKVEGNNSFVWNGKNLTSGIYVCRLEAGKTVASRNIILMK
jgi:hypothetical protein